MNPAIEKIDRPGGRPRLGLGCVRLGSMGGRGARLVQHALDLGVRIFDTADAYGNGQSEVVLGRALRKRRHEAFVATKGGYLFRERSAAVSATRLLVRSPAVRWARAALPAATGPRSRGPAYASQNFNPVYLRAALDASLRRLGTDYVDLYQIHGPRALQDDVLDFAAEMLSAGKIRGFGIGVEDLASAEDWISTGSLSHIQVPFGFLDPAAGERVIPAAAARSVSVLARGVYAAGFIASPAGRDMTQLQPGQPELLARLAQLAGGFGVSPLQIATWFVTARTEVSGLLIGTSSAGHLTEAVRYVQTAPDEEIMKQVQRLHAGPPAPAGSSRVAP